MTASVSSINRYNTTKNLARQHHSGFMDGLCCNRIGMHNDNGKTSEALNMAYLEGYAEGRLQHEFDVMQSRGIQAHLRLVA